MSGQRRRRFLSSLVTGVLGTVGGCLRFNGSAGEANQADFENSSAGTTPDRLAIGERQDVPASPRPPTDNPFESQGERQTERVDDAPEPINGFQEATPMDPGTYEDLRVVDRQRDFFRLDLSAGEPVPVTIRFDHRKGHLELDVHTSDHRRVATSHSGTDDERLSFAPSVTGQYYLVVNGLYGASARYSLTVEAGMPTATDTEVPTDRFEPNDEPREATAIEPGVYEDLYVGSTLTDLYTIDLVEGDRMEVGVTYSTVDVEMVMVKIHAPADANIARSVQGDGNELVTYTATTTGQHLIDIASFMNEPGTYSLTVALVAG